MKTRHSILALLTLVLLGSGPAFGAEPTEEELEPCINGAVSASGSFASQEQENAARMAEAEPETIGSGDDALISAFGGNRDNFLR